MRSSVRRARHLAAPLVLAAVTALACTDRPGPVEPGPDTPTGKPAPPAAEPVELARMDCAVSVREETVTCGPPAPAGAAGDSAALIIYGGQDRYVTLTSSSVDYDSTTLKFRMNVTVRNLIRQAIGTTDGSTADPAGTMVFFVTPPTMTAGTGGTVAIDNADGTAMFTASDQPFFRYVQRLEQYAVSSPRTWQFNVPTTVERFAFSVMVAAPVQYPTGWIETSHPVWSMRRTFSRLVTATVYNQYGNEIPDATVTWTSYNPAVATVAADSGYVSGLLPGTVDLVATSTNDVIGTPGATQTGVARFTITGVSQTWTAGVGTDDWNNPGNWSRGVSPVAQDSATVPVIGGGIYPRLVENEEIGAVTVADGAEIALGAFNLTASDHVQSAPLTGGITSVGGRLILTGYGKNVSGRLPRMRVTGSYSLTGNVRTVAPLQTQGGRLRNTAFRIRVDGQ